MKHYIATINYVIEEEGKSGKISYKTKKDKYLVNSSNIPSVHKTLKKVLQGVYDSFEISSVSESQIVGYIDETKDVIGNN